MTATLSCPGVKLEALHLIAVLARDAVFGTAASVRRDGSMCEYTYRVCSSREFGVRGGSVGKSSVPVSDSSVETSLDESSIHSNVWESKVRDSSLGESSVQDHK